MAGYGKQVFVTNTRHCRVVLESPSTPSLLLYDSNNQVVWRDGSTTFPICLPELQSASSPAAYMLGMTSEGCVVKIPITYEEIETCEGPVLTVPTIEVT